MKPYFEDSKHGVILYNCDCRELLPTLADGSVDLVLTDPPYGIDFKYDLHDDNADSYAELLKFLITQSCRIVRDGCMCFVFQAQPQLRLTWPMFPDDSRIFAACKNFVQIRPTPVQFAYDPVVFWQKAGTAPFGFNGRDWHIGNTAATMNRGKNEAKGHPCPRPIDTVAYITENFSPKSGLLLDPFSGSGTSLLAALCVEREAIGVEISEAYCEISAKRLQREIAQGKLFDPEPTPEPKQTLMELV